MGSQSLEVLFEDNHLLVINKPAGVLVQGDVTGDVPLVEAAKQYIKQKYDKPGAVFLGVVHRIDRPVSGVVVFARTSKALERMNALFRDRKTEKIYWAVVKDAPYPHEATLTHWLRKDQQRNVTKAFLNELEGTQYAELTYQVLKVIGKHSLVEIKPHTGRSHQIRVQLAYIGCPIMGDLKYGYSKRNKDASICLHARKLSFEHPVSKERMTIEAPLPDIVEWGQFK